MKTKIDRLDYFGKGIAKVNDVVRLIDFSLFNLLINSFARSLICNIVLGESDFSYRSTASAIDWASQGENTSEVKKQNAERVETDTNLEVAQTEEEIASSEEEVNVSAGTNSEVIFSNPVDGVISRGYTYPKPQAMSDGVCLVCSSPSAHVCTGPSMSEPLRLKLLHSTQS